MSSPLETLILDPVKIIALIEAMDSTGINAGKAWDTIVAIVNERRDPTPAEWALGDLSADQADNAVEALIRHPNVITPPPATA